MSQTKILIVGAGPTGLSLALRLARYGIDFRIVDRANGPGEASRAMALHARTLELYRQLGLAEEILHQAIPIEAIHLRGNGRELAALSFKDIGKGLSPYPYVVSYPQDDHERFLVGKLEAAGHPVEWGTTLKDLKQDDAGVRATLAHDGNLETCTADYVCGCDGAHSRVRQALALDFPGGTYASRFYVVDAKLAGDFTTDGAANLGDETFALKLPVRSRGMQRLIGLVPPNLADRTDLTFEDIRPTVQHLLGVKVEMVNWFSTYLSHHRVAAHFRVGRCFIAGDAGHVHSPAGGQGMNTGIGDAVNLAWKLAAVVEGRADADLLDSYEPERIAFARKLVATTDTAFRIPIRAGRSGRFLRGTVLPHLLPALLRTERFRRFLFRTISQTRITYCEKGALNEGRAGRVRGGDRLPWLPPPDADNFAPLLSLDWQVHVIGEANAALRKACSELALPVYTFAWSANAERAGFARDAAYLVRPDTYVGLALPDQDAGALRDYVRRHRLRFEASGGAQKDPVNARSAVPL